MQRKEWKAVVNKLEKRRKELGFSHEEITDLLDLNYWALEDLWSGYTNVELYKLFMVAELLQLDLKIELRDKVIEE